MDAFPCLRTYSHARTHARTHALMRTGFRGDEPRVNEDKVIEGIAYRRLKKAPCLGSLNQEADDVEEVLVPSPVWFTSHRMCLGYVYVCLYACMYACMYVRMERCCR